MMTTTETTTETLIPLNQLRVDEIANVRRAGRGAAPIYMASIKAHGVQTALKVRPNGKGFMVFAGGKRLASLQALAKGGEIGKDYPVRCQVCEISDEQARELSLVENVVREPMHPVDEFRAFADLANDKTAPLDADAIARRFGADVKIVRQRLALGALHDTILDAWVAGEINADTAKAFTLCPSKADQAKVFAKVKEEGRGVHAYRVKGLLRDGQENAGKYLEAVGLDAYRTRGGEVTEDLFGQDHIISDPALLMLMADELLKAKCQELVAEGWGWAETPRPDDAHRYSRIDTQFKPTPDEKKKLAELEARMEDDELDYEENEKASEAYDELEAEIRARSITAKQKASAGCFVYFEHDGTLMVESGRIKPAELKAGDKGGDLGAGGKSAKKAKPEGGLSKALTERLTMAKHAAVKKALLNHPYASEFEQKLASIVSSQINEHSAFSPGPHSVMSNLDAIIKGLNVAVLNAELRKAFNAKDYFESCGKAACLAAITEAVNADEARKLGGAKKAEIAKFALTNVGKGRWLPKELRAPGYDGPSKAAARPQEKAKAKAKAKPAAKAKAKAKPAAKAKAKRKA